VSCSDDSTTNALDICQEVLSHDSDHGPGQYWVSKIEYEFANLEEMDYSSRMGFYVYSGKENKYLEGAYP
jgi:hypothetical protein